jgi:SAM-dependent methyltransferase
MGRFATTVPYYSRYREPYPPSFFETVAKRLNFNGNERLVDIGCGPAPLAIGFGPYVASCTGVDPEPAMLAAAGEQAARTGVRLDLIEARIEHLPEISKTFDIVTIGRALHWMEPHATVQTLDRIVAEGGAILICGATPPAGPSNPWLEPYNEVRKLWVDHRGEERYSADAEERFIGSRFRFAERIVVSVTHSVTVEELVGRSLSRSTTSPQVLGGKLAEFERALTEAVRPFECDGAINEEIQASTRIFR